MKKLPKICIFVILSVAFLAAIGLIRSQNGATVGPNSYWLVRAVLAKPTPIPTPVDFLSGGYVPSQGKNSPTPFSVGFPSPSPTATTTPTPSPTASPTATPVAAVTPVPSIAPTPAPTPLFCGGPAGIQCPPGYTCLLSGSYADAGGTCIPIVAPTPTVEPVQRPSQIANCDFKLELAKAAVKTVQTKPLFAKFLMYGMRNAEIRKLQTFLKQFPDIYPEGRVTGYFGPLTEAAVIRLQRQLSLPETGVFDSRTRAELNNPALQ